ncbi:Type 1 glutamine amidotransferase-like domain-containing protein [Enterobacter ludwigii]|nr:Type 1 glutamine amidotransferase-like domain-containing protein [Enterobacter ludwigii]
MKLFLSSMYFGNEAEALLKMHSGSRKVAICLNANDFLGDIGRLKYYNRTKKDFESLGFEVEEIDLRNYFNRIEELKSYISKFGIFWATGGNTFNLRRAFKLSGMDLLLPGMLNGSDFIYGGFSAGACIMSPSLAGLNIVDNPEEIPFGYDEEIIWSGLNLVEYQIVPHYKSGSEDLATMMQEIINYYDEINVRYIKLTDEQSVVINVLI